MDPLVVFQNVSKHFKDFSIQNVSFSLDTGYIMGLVGCNGSGKTTLFHLLLNQYKDYEGTLLVDGMNTKTQSILVKEKIGFISEASSYFLGFDAITNANFYAPLYPSFNLSLFCDTINLLNIPLHDQPLSTFSKGTMMKFQLAFAIAYQPKLYLMDEPTAGLDPVFRRDFSKLLQDIVAKQHASIIISTHITSDLDKIVDYIGLLENGKMVSFDDRETLTEKLMRESKLPHLRISDLLK